MCASTVLAQIGAAVLNYSSVCGDRSNCAVTVPLGHRNYIFSFLHALTFCEKQESRSGLFHLEPNAKRPKAPSHRETLHVQFHSNNTA